MPFCLCPCRQQQSVARYNLKRGPTVALPKTVPFPSGKSLRWGSNHSADAAVFGLGAAGRRRRGRRLAVVVRSMLGVGGVRPVAVGTVRVAVRGRGAGWGVVLVRRVRNVRWGVVVMEVVVRRRILHVANLSVVGVHLGLGLSDALTGRVVQVGRVRDVRDECRVGGV